MWSDRALIGVLLWASLGSCNLSEEIPDDRVTQADDQFDQGVKAIKEYRFEDGEILLREAFRGHVAAGAHAGASADAAWMMRRYRYATNYRMALEWGDRAYAEAVASDDDARVGQALIGLVQTLQYIDDSAAIAELLPVAVRYAAEVDQASQIELLAVRGLERRSNGRPAESERYHREALAKAREIGDLRFIQGILSNLADLALSRGKLKEAEEYLREARALLAQRGLPPSRTLLINEASLARDEGRWRDADRLLDESTGGASPDEIWRIHRHRGLTAEGAGDLDLAERWYRSSIEEVELLRRESAPAANMAEFLEKRWGPFQDLFALQVGRGDARGALDTLLRAQGRMFLDAMAQPALGASPPGTIEGALGDAMDGLDRARDLVPALASSPLADVQEADEVLAALRDRHVLTYFQGGGRLRLLVIEDGQPRIANVDVGTEELTELITDFRLYPEDPLAAANLGAAILPSDALPAEGGRIYVVTTGAVLRVPLAALIVSGQRVVDRHEVSYVPSVTSLALDRQPTRASGGRPAVVIADSRLVVHPEDAELSVVIGTTGAASYLGRQATTAAFRSSEDANLLHLIAHSGVNARGGYLSLHDDQEVTATDILRWGMRPRLVVLLTCASAVTPRSEMWGSLAAAFLAAGSEHVVATLSAVPTEDASTFAVAFYRHGGMKDPVGAVARAQRHLAGIMPVGKWSQFVVTGP